MVSKDYRRPPKVRKKYEDEIKRFEETYSGFKNLEKIKKNCYIVNGNLDDFKRMNKQKLLVYLPYCLKPLECLHRLEYSCDSDCNDCVIGPMVRFLEKHEIKSHFIIYDDIDVPKGIEYQITKHEKIYGVVCVLCPEAAIENKRFADMHDVPILLFFINGFEDCDFKKATKGKFWGITTFDYDSFEEVMNKIVE